MSIDLVNNVILPNNWFYSVIGSTTSLISSNSRLEVSSGSIPDRTTRFHNKIMTRAERRYKSYIHKKRARNYLANIVYYSFCNDKAIIGQRAKTRAPCNCMGCSNSRKFLGKTLQELRFDDKSKEWNV